MSYIIGGSVFKTSTVGAIVEMGNRMAKEKQFTLRLNGGEVLSLFGLLTEIGIRKRPQYHEGEKTDLRMIITNLALSNVVKKLEKLSGKVE